MAQASRRTLQDVADAAGLSLAATSYALRGLKGSPTTIERVQAAARSLDYSVDPIARALASGRTGSVAIMGSLRDLWQQDLSVMLTRALRDVGRFAIIADADADPHHEQRIVEQLVTQRVDGVLVQPVDPSAQYWRLFDAGTAVVSIGDALTTRSGSGEVAFDNRRAVRAALGHLAELGHREVALLSPSLPTTPGRPAQLLAAQVAASLGLDLVAVSAPATLAGAAGAAAAVLSVARPPTALFCLSDSLAFGAYQAARDLGRRIPADVSVVGSDDHQMADLVSPALTTLGWDEDEIVASALRQLVDLLEGRPAAPASFSPHLIVRGSTAPVSDAAQR